MDKIHVAGAVIGILFIGAAILYSDKASQQLPVEEPGIRQEVGAERQLRSWERGGTTVTLYEQDLEVAYEYYSGPATEQVLKARRADGEEVVLDRYQFAEDFTQEVEEVSISPLGTYVTAEIQGYESRPTNTYAASTGELIISSATKRIPYWTDDEKKAALIESGSGMDGTRPAFFYSSNGNLQDRKPLKEFDDFPYIKSTVQKGNLLIMTMVDVDGDPAEREYVLDLQSGTLRAG